jgi:hypothetical protein
MPMTKVLIEVSAIDGLQQKLDPSRLTDQNSASAVNLVKNKQGRLEKRLGFTPLSSNTLEPNAAANFSFQWSRGIAVANYNQRLVGIGSGIWNANGALANQTITTIQTYSEDSGAWLRRGLVSEVNVAEDAVLAGAPTTAYCISQAVVGDYQMVVWLAAAGVVWYLVREISTGNIVQPPQVANAKSSVLCLRLALVGATAVVAFSTGTTIWVQNLSAAEWVTTPLSSVTPTSITTNNSTSDGIFDMRSANDGTNYIVAWSITTGGNTYVEASQCTGTSVTASVRLYQIGTNDSGEEGAVGYGIYCNGTSALMVVFGILTSTVNGSGVTINTLNAVEVEYPAMTIVSGPTTIYTAASVGENMLAFVYAVAPCGPGGQVGGYATWMVVWSPAGSAFLATPTQDPGNNARLLCLPFKNISGLLTPFTLRVTPGIIASSQLVPANGILYVLGWIPSSTQGTYVLLACDFCINPSENTPYAARPVAMLQTRTALSGVDTAPLYVESHNLNSPVGLSEWGFVSVEYSTWTICYLTATVGTKLVPAAGQIQFTPTKGYPTAQYGNLLAIGGALPSLYDGSNVFEQSFAYAPDSAYPNATFPSAGLYAQTNGTDGTGPNFVNVTDTVSYIVTYEQPDAQGNIHISARSITLEATCQELTNNTKVNVGQFNIDIFVATQGVTNRQYLANATLAPVVGTPPPPQSIKIAIYRTIVNGSQFFRLSDPNIDGTDAAGVPYNELGQTVVKYTDIVPDSELQTRPLLYGDGSDGEPGALDDYCPGANNILVNHNQRIFVARGNLVLFTKSGVAQPAQLLGPGYNEQVNAFTVGGVDDIIAAETLDSTIVFFKAREIWYVAGDGGGNDGSGSSLSSPQQIPTDVGAADSRSIRTTPDGIYFQSPSGLRLLTRGLEVKYVGGPVEDELVNFPLVTSALYHPSANRVVLTCVQTDLVDAGSQALGEIVWRDTVLDAWTTAVIQDGAIVRGFLSSAAALAPRLTPPVPSFQPVLHFMDASGVVWREQDPNGAAPYYDNATYISTIWTSAPIAPNNHQGRFRLWDILVQMRSMSPHGLVMGVTVDYGNSPQTRYWSWLGNNGGGAIIPNATGPLVTLRGYDGRLGESFQVALQDVADPATVTGQGAQFLGLTLALGVAEGPYKVPPTSTQ